MNTTTQLCLFLSHLESHACSPPLRTSQHVGPSTSSSVNKRLCKNASQTGANKGHVVPVQATDWTGLACCSLLLVFIMATSSPHLKRSYGMCHNWNQTCVRAEPCPLPPPDWPNSLFSVQTTLLKKVGHKISVLLECWDVAADQTRICLLWSPAFHRATLLKHFHNRANRKTGKTLLKSRFR